MRENLVKIEALLAACTETEWRKSFDFFIQKLDREGERAVKESIRPIYGGMGSFNDLILYWNGDINHEKNTQMASLRSELFSSINQP